MTAREYLMHTDEVGSLRYFNKAMHESISSVEREMAEATELGHVCSNEWCLSIEHVLDELSNELFSISEPRWSRSDNSMQIKNLKCRLHNLYTELSKVTH